jgi:hypothetical protein
MSTRNARRNTEQRQKMRKLKEKLETAREIVTAIEFREKLKMYNIVARGTKWRAAVAG